MLWLRVAAIGLAYFGAQLVWALYNAFLPLLYGRFVGSNALIGGVMVLDNVAALTLQPAFAALSDRVWTRLGRRLPFLLVGMPLTALCFALIPRADALAPLLLATVAMNLGMAVFSSPSIALMPDVTPPRWRGRANGVINLLGGLGALVAFFALGPLFERRRELPFDLAAALLVLAAALVALLVRERPPARDGGASPGGAPAPAAGLDAGGLPGGPGGLAGAVRAVVTGPDRRVAYLLLASLCAVAAVNGAQNMFTRFGVHHWGQTPGQATFLLGFFALAFIALAVPAGALGDRVGRLRAVRAGIAGTLATFALLPLLPGPDLAPPLLLFGGACWALWVTNAYPVLTDLTPPTQAGTYAGLWNAAIGLAGLVSPPLYGAVVDLWGFGAFFLPGIAFLALTLALSLRLGPDARPEARAGRPPRAASR